MRPLPPVVRRAASLILLAAFAVAAAVLAVLWMRHVDKVRGIRFTADYGFDADPALRVGLSGRFWEMFGTDPQPLMLPFALVTRLPSLAVQEWTGYWAHSWKEAVDVRHDAGAIGALAVAAFAVACAMPRAGWRQLVASLTVAAAVIANPLAIKAMDWGHVEEALGAAMVCASVICATRGKWTWSAVCAGLAAATKQPFFFALPTLFLLVEPAHRKRWAAVTVGVIAAVLIPFLVPHLGAFLHANAGTATASGHGTSYEVSLFAAFDIRGLGFLGKPIAALLALVLPIVAARRTGWRLTPTAASATLFIVLLWRCLLDPFNIAYYMAPAASLLIVLDWQAFNAGCHPAQRIPFVRRLDVFVPVLGLAGAMLVHWTLGGPIETWWGNLFGDVHGKDYVLDIVVATALAAPAAFAVRLNLTPSRKRLYGAAAAVALLLLIASQTVGGGMKAGQDVVALPDGFAAGTPQAVAAHSEHHTLYWMGNRSIDGDAELLRAGVEINPKHGLQARSMFIYGPGGDGGLVTAITRVYGPDTKDQNKLVSCKPRCPKGYTTQDTPIGQAVVRQGVDIWEAVIPTAEGSVYVVSDLKDARPQDFLSRLAALPVPGQG